MDATTVSTFQIKDQQCIIRQFNLAGDSITELTELLHRSYRKMAEMGLRFVASWQDDSRTLRRISNGVCLIAVIDGKLIGSITYYLPGNISGSPWYEIPGVAQFQQFAVDPHYQKLGIGHRLLSLVEFQMAKLGVGELALDTSERADELIQYYERRGYRFIEYVQWPQVNYRSCVMSRTLVPIALNESQLP